MPLFHLVEQELRHFDAQFPGPYQVVNFLQEIYNTQYSAHKKCLKFISLFDERKSYTQTLTFYRKQKKMDLHTVQSLLLMTQLKPIAEKEIGEKHET